LVFFEPTEVLGIEGIADYENVAGLTISMQELDSLFIVAFVLMFVLGHVMFCIVAYKRNIAEWKKEGIDDELDVKFMQQKNSREEYKCSDSNFALISAMQMETAQ